MAMKQQKVSMLVLILRRRQIIMRERFPWEIFSCYQMRIEMRKLIFVILSVSLRYQNFFHNQKKSISGEDIFSLEVLFL